MKAALAAADGSALQRRSSRPTAFIEVAGERLDADDVEVRAARHEAFALAEDGGWAVALDLELDDDLRREGLARELVRALNDLRKEQGLAIADRVRLRLGGDDTVRAAVAAHGTWIADEVLAVELTWADGGDLSVRVDGVGRDRGPGAGGLTSPVTGAGRAAGAGSSAPPRPRSRPAGARAARPRPGQRFR